MFNKKLLKRLIVGTLSLSLMLGNILNASASVLNKQEVFYEETQIIESGLEQDDTTLSEAATSSEENQVALNEETPTTPTQTASGESNNFTDNTETDEIENTDAVQPNAIKEESEIKEEPETKEEPEIKEESGIIEETGEKTLIAGVEINSTNFPDDLFRKYVVSFQDKNIDGFLSTQEAENVLGIQSNGDNVDRIYKNLKGIEYFTNLRTLMIADYDRATLDLSKNTKLGNLAIENSDISSLDLSKNVNLSVLSIDNCKITSIDLSKNTSLSLLEFINCNIKSINTSFNTELYDLYFENCSIESLDISKNILLESLVLYKCDIKSINTSKNVILKYLVIEDCPVKSVDLSNNTKLEGLYLCYLPMTSIYLDKNIELTNLVLKNTGITGLKINKLTKLAYLVCENNIFPYLNVSIPNNTSWIFANYSDNDGIEYTKNVDAYEKTYYLPYSVVVDSKNQYDTRNIQGFDPSRILSIKGGTIKNGIITFTSDIVTYRYIVDTTLHSGQQVSQEFSLKRIKPEYVKTVDVSYRTHVQSYGWQAWKTNGQMSGTSAEAKRLEGIELKVAGNSNVGIKYRTHVQSYGWQAWKSDGQMSGTSGEAKRLEAIQIELTGIDKDKYDIYYRVHAQSYGWLDWAKNGEKAGTAGQAKRLEAIEIKVVKKGSTAPGKTALKYIELGKIANNGNTSGLINYKTHVQTYGWQSYVYDGSVSGTFGEAKRLEGIKINLSNAPYSGGIEYRTHIQTYGWEKVWKKNGEMSGTSGEAKRLEAIEIKLTGVMAEKYDIYYRVHAQSFGWMGWAKNGQSAGTAGHAKRLEAIQIVLIPKGQAAPGETKGAYIAK